MNAKKRMGRDNFSAENRTILAKRAGYRCSKPSCRMMTVGPSRESPEAVASVGFAAHISAASKGGPRYEASLSPEERASLRNGIWLCATHATLIDRDVVRHPSELLHRWKEQHEAYVASYLGEIEPGVIQASIELAGAAISSDAARVLTERAPYWEYVLLAQLIRDEIATVRNESRDLRYGVAIGKCSLISAEVLIDELLASNHQIQLQLDAAMVLFGQPTQDALGPPGVEGDPELIAYLAHRLGGVYRLGVLEGLRWLHTRCSWDEAQRLLALAPRYGMGIIDTIERFPDQLDNAMLAAQADEGDERVTHNVEITFDLPDEVIEDLGLELDRLAGIIRNRGWPV